ncbi:hypothetical protein HJC99_00475 [Candidatus Saccharibacteria bacterium]|nr:hypothetical protein [Candidatus Saccharibacteria bacterium]
MNKPVSKPKKHVPFFLKITAIITATVILIVGIGLIAIRATPTNENAFTGVKFDAAQQALTYDKSAYSPDIVSSYTKQQVVSVVPSVGNNAKGVGVCSTNPGEVAYYTVTVKRIFLFGTTYATKSYNMCNLAS